MTKEAIQIIVFRRHGALFVVPGVLSDTGFESLREVIPVTGQDALLDALERGASIARKASELPRSQRFLPGTPYWEAVGCRRYEDFVNGTTAIEVVTNGERTRLSFLVPAPRNEGLIGKGAPLELGAGITMSDTADRVRQIFNERNG